MKVLYQLDSFVDTTITNRHPVPVSVLREETIVDYPHWATRELLMNAICHRTYDSNGPIQFYEYDDRIEIQNHGNLYGKANAENFPHVNDYRNIVIAESLRVLGFVNRFSRGVQRVEDDLVANGNGMPEFDLSLGTAFKVIERKAHLDETNNETLNETLKPSGYSDELSENHRKLLHLLSLNSKWQYTDFQSAMSISRAQVGRIMRELKDVGYIDRIGSKKTGEWQILKPLNHK